MKTLSIMFSYLLVAGAVGMSLWGILGFAEYFSGNTFIVPLQSPTFPKGTQFIHWFLITLSGIVYLAGYFRRWKITPNLMITIYACMATMCFIQTFDFMVRPDRYVSFVIECINYILISTYLFKSERMKNVFQRN